jgi:hypothetical protein
MADIAPIQPPDRTTRFMRVFITVSLFLIYAGVLAVLLLKQPAVTLTDAVGTLVVALISILTREIGTIISFNFSSTAASVAKDDTQRAQAETIAAMAAPAPPASSPHTRPGAP